MLKDQLRQIRELLEQIEAVSDSVADEDIDRDFSALELPTIIQEIVDDLQPLITPYDAAFYWYAFRHSIARDGNPHVRLSTRKLQSGIVKSSYSWAAENKIAQSKVAECLRALVTVGALRKEGEPNRQGTPYRVLIPDEIEACRKFRAERTSAEPEPVIADADIDYYNVHENRVKVFERDEYKCRYCEKQLTRFTATLDHVRPVSDGGDNSLDNLVTACLDCNSRKHHRLLSDFLVES